MKTYLISVTEVNALGYGLKHYPEGLPKRWILISEFVRKCSKTYESDNDIRFAIGEGSGIGRAAGRTFRCTAEDCRQVAKSLNNSNPELLQCDFLDYTEIVSDCSPNAHKPIILLPPKSKCMKCGETTVLRSRCGFPIVYTDTGPQVAAAYNSNCVKCSRTYYHSFYEEREADVGPLPTKRIYYAECTEEQYLTTSLLTAFEMKYLKRVDEEIAKGCMSFEACAQIYNAVHKEDILQCENTFKDMVRRNNSAKLEEQRVEDGWFTFTLLTYLIEENLVDVVTFELDVTGRRRNIERVCEIAVDVISKSKNEWLDHRCDTLGCAEGYVSIDGNEKVRRSMCAAPFKNIQLSKSMAKVIQCCPHSPITGGRSGTPSKYCAGHRGLEVVEDEEKKDSEDTCNKVHEKILLSITMKDVRCVSTRIVQLCNELPRNDDDSVLQGCKDPKNVNRFYNRTAGVICMVRPCGYIVDFMELFTCESCSQVFLFLLRTCLQEDNNIRYIGYDRVCEFVPFLENLSRKGNLGADYLLNGRQYLVDLFHCQKHKRKTCMPLEDNPDCRYHPKLDRFSAIHGVNTQCAEQTFKWLNKFKLNTRRMTQFKFKFYLWHVIGKRNVWLSS